MYRGKDILLNHLFTYYYGVLEVVSFPGHECHLQVTAKGELTVFGSVALRQHLSLHHLLTFSDDGDEVDGGILVRLVILGQHITLYVVVEAHELLFVASYVSYDYLVGIDILHHAVALGNDKYSGVFYHLCFETGAHYRRLRLHQRHCLTHHVGTHEGTVGIIVFKEGYQ